MMARILVLLLWTLTVTEAVYDQARDEWVVEYAVADDAGQEVARHSVQLPASLSRLEAQGRLRAILESVRAVRSAPAPVAHGFTVTSP